jgi:hypothetical protein
VFILATKAQPQVDRRVDNRMSSTKAVLMVAGLVAGFGGFSLASPTAASAEPGLDGTYTYLVTEEIDRGAPVEISAVRTWTITTCGQGCAHVSSSADRQPYGSGAYEGDLQLVDGVWQMTVARPDLAVCNDGRHLPGTVSYSVDSTTLTGTANGTVPADCDGAPGGFQDTFTLRHTS